MMIIVTRDEDDPTTAGHTAVLIEADELAGLLAGGLAGADTAGPALVLADVRWALGGSPGRPQFEAGHLPGAQFVDLETELSGPHPDDPSTARPGGRHPLPAPADFEAAMRRIGVDENSTVIVYDQANALAAARLWWLLTDAGHPSVRVLNGGLDAWVASGGELETGAGSAVPAGRFTARPGHRARVDADALASMVGTAGAPPIADVRAYPRYTGATEPMDPVAGHIPGAVSAPSPANQDAAGRFVDPEQIRARYRDLDAAGEPVFYCGSGITAAHTLLARESAGLTAGAIYAGSWSDWISDPDRPIATGDGPQL